MGAGDGIVEPLSIGVAWVHVCCVRAVVCEVEAVVALGQATATALVSVILVSRDGAVQIGRRGCIDVSG